MKIYESRIRTPIGNICFDLQASVGEISNANISIKELEPVLPEGMEVEGSVAVLLTLVSPMRVEGLQFSCSWTDFDTKGDACSGEGLDAWEWDDNSQLVVIGTEDGDLLSTRLSLGEITRENYPVSMEKNCIKINIEQYPKNQELSLHFVISNNKLPEKEDCSCWYAVDIAHSRIVDAFR